MENRTGLLSATYVHGINQYQEAEWPELMDLHRARFGPAQLDAMLERIARLGFTHVELWVGHTGNCCSDELWNGATPDTIRSCAEKHDLELASFCPGGIGEEKDITPMCKFAKALGVPMMTGWLGRDPELPGILAGYLDRYELSYGIEPHPPEYSLLTADEIMAACESSARLGACPDTGNWEQHGVCAVEAMEKVLPRVIHTHLKGYCRATGQSCPPGQDDIGTDRIVAMLRDSGYDGVYSMEYEADHDPDPELAQSLAWLESILEE